MPVPTKMELVASRVAAAGRVQLRVGDEQEDYNAAAAAADVGRDVDEEDSAAAVAAAAENIDRDMDAAVPVSDVVVRHDDDPWEEGWLHCFRRDEDDSAADEDIRYSHRRVREEDRLENAIALAEHVAVHVVVHIGIVGDGHIDAALVAVVQHPDADADVDNAEEDA